MSFTRTTVTGRLHLANGEPAAGVPVTAALSATMHNGTEQTPVGTQQVSTSATGDFSFTLPANTDEGTFPPGAHYTFECAATGLDQEAVVPASSEPVLLASLAVAGGGVGATGPTGPTGGTGAKGATGPTGPVSKAAYVEPTTATAKAIAESLIAAGIMEGP